MNYTHAHTAHVRVHTHTVCVHNTCIHIVCGVYVCVHSCVVQGVSCLLLVDHVTIIHSLGSLHICHTTEGT